MIATKEEVKSLLGIPQDNCDKDEQIEAWLPQMPDMIAKHTNNFLLITGPMKAGFLYSPVPTERIRQRLTLLAGYL